jgi:hypothetical protein
VTRLRGPCSREPKFASKKWSGHNRCGKGVQEDQARDALPYCQETLRHLENDHPAQRMSQQEISTVGLQAPNAADIMLCQGFNIVVRLAIAVDTAGFDCEDGHRGLEQSCKLGKPLGIVASAPIGVGGYGTKVSPQSVRRRRHEQ